MKSTLTSILFVLIAITTVVGQWQNSGGVYRIGDTIFRAEDRLPSNPRLVHPNLQDYWDFTGLLAPYVHEIYIRAQESDDNHSEEATYVSFSDSDGLKYTVIIEKANMWISDIQIPVGDHFVKGKCDPYLPLRVNTAVVGEESEYSGTVVFNLPTELVASLEDTELSLADSIHIVVEWNYHIANDQNGQMQTESGLYNVLRQKLEKTVNAYTEIRQQGNWSRTNKETSVDLPDKLKAGITFSFWSNEVADPLAVVQTDAYENALSVSFRVQKQSGRRVVKAAPSQPDIYVYPNPSFGVVRFDLVNIPDGSYELEIYNILGVRLRSYPLDIDGSISYPLNLTDLKKGTYIYRLVDAFQKTLRSKRLVIITP